MMGDARAAVGVIMGSQSDWETLKHAVDVLEQFRVPYEARVVSAHRTPDLLFEYAEAAESRGLKVIIAGAGGAAHLPGMCAAKTSLPVLGVPVESSMLRGLDSLLSIVQMPGGVPVGTLAIGPAGAKNAALLAIAILALQDSQLQAALKQYRLTQTQLVLDQPDPRGGQANPRRGQVDSRGGHADPRGDHPDPRGSQPDSRGGQANPRSGQVDSRGGHADSRGGHADPRGGQSESWGGQSDSRGGCSEPGGGS